VWLVLSESYHVTLTRHPDGSVDLTVEADEGFRAELVRLMLESGQERSQRSIRRVAKTNSQSRAPLVYEIARRWVDNLHNDPLMAHSISGELDRWRTSEGLSREQVTKRDRSRIRYYVVSAERFLEAKLRKHGLRFETIGSYHDQTRRLTQPLDLAEADMMLTETRKSDTPEPITSQ
jgi:hypothetical protein